MRIVIFLLAAGMAITSPSHAAEKTTAAMIRQAAQQFLDHYAADREETGQTVTYSLGPLDSRLNLAACPDGPSVSFSSDPTETTQPTLSVSCDGQRPWRLYLSTSLEIRGQGLVAARPLSRGERITGDMIATQPIVINSVRRGAITQRDALVGLEVRRSVNSGTIFTPDIVTQPEAVSRGDHVIIIARSGSISVQSRGKALSDGRVGEQIMVQNLRSAKTLRAQVTSPGHVEVPM
ncbi:flagellar basal body P-ring formation protein FlgA [Marinobacter halodurans]|uniref:Flagella basal body P-ring formation protein FlgA n=1 Tax=Marinobacter halodurans TaxID=2528979 RepID=A0ABY1ZRU4_9GAMM|nr:flagellar basal body P-ring formation chaperone FlgA [Marinobacter halodurans]TBW59007.1 flagellar basal body P-ring formation protein FlgA [Marinobacter halodurans]